MNIMESERDGLFEQTSSDDAVHITAAAGLLLVTRDGHRGGDDRDDVNERVHVRWLVN